MIIFWSLGDEFAMSFILFNYMIYGQSNQDDLLTAYLPGTADIDGNTKDMTGDNVDNFDAIMADINDDGYSVQSDIKDESSPVTDGRGCTIFVDGTIQILE